MKSGLLRKNQQFRGIVRATDRPFSPMEDKVRQAGKVPPGRDAGACCYGVEPVTGKDSAGGAFPGPGGGHDGHGIHMREIDRHPIDGDGTEQVVGELFV